MDKTVEVIAFYASATQNALVILSKCLMDNGALKPGQFSSAIKATLNEAGVDLQKKEAATYRDKNPSALPNQRTDRIASYLLGASALVATRPPADFSGVCQ